MNGCRHPTCIAHFTGYDFLVGMNGRLFGVAVPIENGFTPRTTSVTKLPPNYLGFLFRII